eukprot:jgi/Mesvir1/11394/Mv10293-RA.1
MSLPVVTIDRLMPSETETGTAEGFWLNLSGRLYDDFEREGMQGFVDKLGRYCLVFNSYEDELEEERCVRRVVDELLCRRVPFSVEFYRGPKGPSDADRVYWRRWESHIDITRPEVRVIRAHLERPHKDPEVYRSVPPPDQLRIGRYSFSAAYRRLLHDYCKDFTVYELVGAYEGENENLPSHASWCAAARAEADERRLSGTPRSAPNGRFEG